VIRPSTTVFGLLTSDPNDGWITKLYNTLFGFNGLDAASIAFIVQPARVADVVRGLLGGRAHHLHVAPSLWRAAAEGSGLSLVDAIDERGPRFEHARRLVAFASPRQLGLLERAIPDTNAARLEALLLEAGVSSGPASLSVDSSFPGEPLRPVDGRQSEVWLGASWDLEPPRRRAFAAETVLGPPFALWLQRAGDELTERFGFEPRVPPDLIDAVTEPDVRPCQLIDDGFRAAYPHLEAR